MSLRSQKVFIWWSLIMTVFYFIALRFLLHMLPPPTARWSAAEIARFYVEHSGEIKVGAVVASFTGGCFVPIVIVIVIQMHRHEQGRVPVWTILGCVGGALMTIFLALPPLFFGVAAFTPDRAADVTSIMHELGLLTLITTDQFYIFLWVAIVVTCLTPNSVVHSPFPRWFGYFSAWTALMFSTAPIAFLTRSGPFAWNGLLAFWSPAILLGVWLVMISVLLINAINAQIGDEVPPTPAEMSAAA